jgi:uncharacterized phage protein (TIGR02220 family)
MAQRVLAHLNAVAGADFRENPGDLYAIALCLSEVGNDEAGVMAMIERQSRLWPPGSEQRQYLRPRTLFDLEKFHQYFGQRHVDAGQKNGDHQTLVDELKAAIETSPAKKGGAFYTAEHTPEDTENLKQSKRRLRELEGK